jgi:hypothetical protein
MKSNAAKKPTEVAEQQIQTEEIESTKKRCQTEKSTSTEQTSSSEKSAHER